MARGDIHFDEYSGETYIEDKDGSMILLSTSGNISTISNNITSTAATSGQVLMSTGTGSNTTWVTPNVSGTTVDKHDAFSRVNIVTKSKFIPMDRISDEALSNHISIVYPDITEYHYHDITNVKTFINNIMKFLDEDVDDHYSYQISTHYNDKRDRQMDIYFSSMGDYDMMIQHLVQWKMEMTDDEDKDQ